MSTLMEISAGYLPLTDSAILVVAAEMGFAEQEGLHLNLTRETSWANIRDRMAIGHFDVAHMLAPMPIAFNLGLSPMKAEVITPMALGTGGNAITVSTALSRQMREHSDFSVTDAKAVGLALKAAILARANVGLPCLTFGVVHPHSVHNIEMRYWMAASGINPESDVEIVIIPPPYMADALGSGQIDGFCVGEPWNSIAVARGHGRIATVKSAIWHSNPEKVLGVRKDWAESEPERLSALIRALYQAALWCGEKNNHRDLAFLLAKPENICVDAAIILKGLQGGVLGPSEASIPDFFEPVKRAANFPWQSHALWLYSQMVRWGMVQHSVSNAKKAEESFRPDLYRAALKPMGIALPGANAKVEGALLAPTPVGSSGSGLILGPDTFFDGQVFDPDFIEAYLASQTAKN